MIGIRPRELDRGEDDWAPCTCDAASALQMREGRVCVCEAGAIVRGADERQFNTSRIESRTGCPQRALRLATFRPRPVLRHKCDLRGSDRRSADDGLVRGAPGDRPDALPPFPSTTLCRRRTGAACASDGSCEARTTTRSKADGTSGIRIRRGCSPASVGRRGPA